MLRWSARLIAPLSMATAACSTSQPSAPTAFSDSYFTALLAEHCLRANPASDPVQTGRQLLRLAAVRERAVAGGWAADVSAAEQRWEQFSTRAEFVCDQRLGTLSQRVDELTGLMDRNARSAP